MSFKAIWTIAVVSLIVNAYMFFSNIAAFMLPPPIISLPAFTQVEILQEDVKIGDQVTYMLNFCKNYEGSVKITRQLLNGSVVYISENSSALPADCYNVVSTPIQIPEGTEEGNHRLRVTLEYRVNFMVTQRYVIETKPFYISSK